MWITAFLVPKEFILLYKKLEENWMEKTELKEGTKDIDIDVL